MPPTIRALPPNTDQLPDGRLRARVFYAGLKAREVFDLDAATIQSGQPSPALLQRITRWVTATKTTLAEQHRLYGGPAPIVGGRGKQHGGAPLDVDIVEYLRQIVHMPKFTADRSHLRAVANTEIRLLATGPLVRVGSLPRHRIDTKAINLMIVAWSAAPTAGGVRRVKVAEHTRDGVTMPGYERSRPATSGQVASAATIRHRVRVIRELFTTLDGKGSWNPAHAAQQPRAPDPMPIGVTPAIVLKVAQTLAQACQPRTRVRPPRDPAAYAARETARQREALLTYVRYLVIVTAGQRPCQVGRLRPEHLTVVHDGEWLWLVHSAKLAPAHTVVLTGPALQAMRAFVAANAFGEYDTTTQGNRVHAAGWPVGIRPFNARHTLMIAALNEYGVDLADVSAMAGHKRLDTTRRFYAPVMVARQRQTAEKINERLADLFTLKVVGS